MNYGGYGQVNVGWCRKKWMAHRFSYRLNVGSIPRKMFVCHRCDNRLCVNPDHLFVGTHQDNMDDMNKKGRHGMTTKPETIRKGVQFSQAKLDDDKVRKIRLLKGVEPHSVTAKKFGVSKCIVGLVQQRKRWAHVSDEAVRRIESGE